MPYLKNKMTGEVVFVPDGPARPPMNPEMPFKAPQAQANVNQTQATTGKTIVDTRKTDQDIKHADALFNPDLRKKTAEAALAELQLERAKQPGANLPPEQRLALQSRQTAISNLESVVNDIEEQYKQNFKGTMPWENGRWAGALSEVVPGSVLGIPTNPTNQKFDSTSLRAGPFIQSILGLGGKDADAAAEYERKVMPFIPKANEGDETTESKLKMLREFINTQKGATNQSLGAPAFNVTPQQANKAIQDARVDLNRQIAGLPPAARQDAVRRFNADPRIQELRRLGGVGSARKPAPQRRSRVIDFNEWGN